MLPELVLRKWFPSAAIKRDTNWLVYAEIGPDIKASPLIYEEQIIGLIEGHPRDDGSNCVATAYFDAGDFAITQDHPLTISPSLQCPTCTHHGFIQEGQWVPA